MFTCSVCSHQSMMKLWKCPNCGSFWSFVEDNSNEWTTSSSRQKSSKWTKTKWSVLKQDFSNQHVSFFNIKDKELQRLFPKGIKVAWFYLLWGEPWIWKSTIALQIIEEVMKNNEIKIWYFSGEETSWQVMERLERIYPDINKDNIFIFHASNLDDIITTGQEHNFDIIFIDSIQTVYSNQSESSAGSISQVRHCSEAILAFCKKFHITTFVIGHVTKMWEIAGPKYLEHIADVVLYLEWDRFWQYRFLRCQKNRFWSTDEVAIYEMTWGGLKAVYDIKQRILDSSSQNNQAGWVLTVWIDNWRAIVVHIEVLLNKSYWKFPERKALWIDSQRLSIIIAILEKYLKCKLSVMDIYINIPWEFKFFDSWIDLWIAAAIYSQYINKKAPKWHIFVGELWLWWQILLSKFHEKRKKELGNIWTFVDKEIISHISKLPEIIG